MIFKAGDKVLFADPRTVHDMFYETSQAKLIAANGKGPFTVRGFLRVTSPARSKENGHIYLEETILYEGTEETAPFMPSRFILAAQKEKPKNHCWML